MKRLPALCLAAVLALSAAPSASAGTYDVKACFELPGSGPQGNGSWHGEFGGPFVAAYTNCPSEGIVTRMSGGPDRAPYGASARQTFTAPPGNRIVRLRGNIRVEGRDGWYGGLVDSTPRWVWCGNTCTTWGQYWWFDIGTNTPQLFAQVTCGNGGGCSRSGLHGIMAMKDVIVTVEDNGAPAVAITGGSVTAGGWRGGEQTVAYSASDPSGIRTVDLFINDRWNLSFPGSCDETTSRPCRDETATTVIPSSAFTHDGLHTVTVVAHDAASNRAETSRQVLVDRTPPAQPLGVELMERDRWRSTNAFELRWRNPPQSAAPIAAARYLICPAANLAGDGRGCTEGRRTGRDISAIVDLRVPKPGDWRAAVWLEDEAGNADAQRSVVTSGMRFDDAAPDLSISPPAERDPTRVRVEATDAVSGVAEGYVEARRTGEAAWRSLPTRLERGGFSAVMDDELLQKGRYELRARAVDHAGNERSTSAEPDGGTATRTLPLRIATRLAVGKRQRVRARGANGKRRYRTVLRVRPRASYGRTIPLTGRLTMPGSNPLAGADVEVWERVKLPATEWRRVSVVRTSARGRFRFKALRGPSRELRFRYPGTETIRARSTVVDLRVRAVTSLRVNREQVVNGEEIRFRGRVKGRPLGGIGKLVHLQVYTRGAWSTFATPRASGTSGRWAQPYRFTATRGLVGYRFRAVVPREVGFPYERGSSRSVRVIVQGI